MKNFISLAAMLMLFAANSSLAQIWQSVQGVPGNCSSIGINPMNKRTVWFGARSRRLFVSYDGGQRVSRTALLPATGNTDSPLYTSVFIHPVDTTFVMAAGTGCFKSTDDGQSWTHALPDTALFLNGESIAYEPDCPDTLYVGITFNRQNLSRFFCRSFDRGQTWQAVNIPSGNRSGFCTIAAGGNGLLLAGALVKGQIWRSSDYGATWNSTYVAPDTLAEVPKIVFDRSDSNIVWATVWGQGGHVVKSTDRGSTWQSYFVPGDPWAIETDRLGRVYVGMLAVGAPGAFMSANGGATWTLLNAGLPTTTETGHAFMLKSDGGLPGLYLADFFSGAHKLETLTTPIPSRANFLPNGFALFQNYPNPLRASTFNPTTKIRYSLPSAQHVVLKVFDVLGREVATLVNKFQTAGDYAIDFDASRLTNSGVYFYQINAGPFQQTRKMIFAK